MATNEIQRNVITRPAEPAARSFGTPDPAGAKYGDAVSAQASDSQGPSSANHAHKIVTVLETIAAADGVLGVRELGRQAGLDKTSASRVLRQLLEIGVVEADEDRQGSYRIGPRLFALANRLAARDEMVGAARPFLKELVAAFDETTYLTLLKGDHAVYRDFVESSRAIRYVVSINEPFTLGRWASGRAMLFDADPDTIDAYAATPDTAGRAAGARSLRAQIEHDRRTGYALSVGERVPDGAAVAAPFRGQDGSIRGALTVAFPRNRLDEHPAEQVGAFLVDVARRLSHRLGMPAAEVPAP